MGRFLALWTLLWGTPWLPAQQEPPSPIKGFYPIGDYLLEIDGVKAPQASFYMAEQIPALLIETPELSLVMLRPGTGTVTSLPSANLSRQPDGTADLLLDSATDQGKLQILASWIVFKVDGHELTVKEKPWLLAQQDIASLQSHSPEFVWRAEAYQPDRAIIEELRKTTTDVHIRVFFGSWCGHCKRHVPLMIKVARELDGSNIHVDYYGLPRAWSNHPVAGPLRIMAVPTGVVFANGKEVGRILGDKWSSPEAAIKEILEQQGVV